MNTDHTEPGCSMARAMTGITLGLATTAFAAWHNPILGLIVGGLMLAGLAVVSHRQAVAA